MPYARPPLLSVATVCLVVLATLCGTGCVVQGQSSGDMKEEMLGSFLFRSADIFYPAGVPEQPGELPALGRVEVSQIEKMYADIVGAIRKQHAEYAVIVSKFFERLVAESLNARVIVTNTGQAVARIESNGDISIDVKVAQAIYRSALLSGLQDRSLGGPRFMDDRSEPLTERESIQEFLALKKRIEETPASNMFGDLAGSLGAVMKDKDDGGWSKKGWFLMAGYKMKSAAVERHYFGQMRFLMAHELGHSALGHAEKMRKIAPNDCEAIHDLEVEADFYATLLHVLSTGQLAMFDTGFGSVVGAMFGIRAVAGFSDFFKYTYDFSGFNAVPGAATCGHPDPKERQKLIEAFYEKLRRAQAEAQLLEAQRRAKERGTERPGDRP